MKVIQKLYIDFEFCEKKIYFIFKTYLFYKAKQFVFTNTISKKVCMCLEDGASGDVEEGIV